MSRPTKRPNLLNPEQKAEWQEIHQELTAKRREKRAITVDHKPFDLWNYDTEHLISELAGVREMIVRIPSYLETRSALQSALDRIWHMEQDIRFLLSLQREMQQSFAAKAKPDPVQTAEAKAAYF